MNRVQWILRAAACLLAAAICLNVPAAQEQLSLDGYKPDASRTERDWEAKFRALPSPAKEREYMRRLSARPHHVGSPYDKDNAEWILAQFQEWGCDAHIETFRRAVSHA